MAVTQVYEVDGVTMGASEISIISGTTSLQTETTPGVYQLWVDAGAMVKADEYILRIYEKVEATGGTKKVAWTQSLMGVQTTVIVSPALMLMNGWDMTIQRVAGADAVFDATIRKA